jgi:hypothetical protein
MRPLSAHVENGCAASQPANIVTTFSYDYSGVSTSVTAPTLMIGEPDVE